jgi:hypothetical protein
MLPFIGPIFDLVGNIFGGVNDHFKAKRELKHAETVTRLAILQRQQTADIDWDTQAMKNAETSWKDEWFVILLSIPAVMAFIPGLSIYVGMGFAELAKAPDWYLGAFGIAVAASFGFRKFADRMVDRGKK